MFEKYVYVILFGLLAIIFSGKSQIWQTNVKRKRKICIFLFLFIIIQNGFRDYLHSTNDTYNYLINYKDLLNVPLADLLKSFSLVSDDYASRDPGFYIFVKLTQYICTNFRFLLVVVASIIAYPLCKMLYRYSTSVAGIFLGMTLYEALFAGFFDTGMRQTVAMGITFNAFLMQQEGKSWKIWSPFVLLAYTFHTSSLIFLPLYFLSKVKNQSLLMRCAIIVTPLIFIMAKPIIAFLGTGTIFEAYAVNSTDNLGTPVFSAMVILVALLMKFLDNKIRSFYRYYQVSFSAMLMALILTPASWIDSNFIRLTFYYLVFLMPILSVFIDAASLKNLKNRSIIYISVAGALIMLSIK